MAEIPIVSVTGVGSVGAVPDAAVLNVAVTGRDATVARALSLMTEAHASALAALAGLGIGEDRVGTAGMGLHQVHDHRREAPGDFVADHALRVRIAEVERAGPVIASLADACGDRFRLDHVELVVDDPEPARRRARQLAVADALVKAEELAVAAGGRVGRILELVEPAGAGPGPRAAKADMMLAAAPAVHPGTTDVVVAVALTVELLPTS